MNNENFLNPCDFAKNVLGINLTETQKTSLNNLYNNKSSSFNSVSEFNGKIQGKSFDKIFFDEYNPANNSNITNNSNIK